MFLDSHGSINHMTTTKQQNNLQANLQTSARAGFLYVLAYAIYIIIFDSGNVLTREAVYYRWMMLALLLVTNTIFWAVTKKTSSPLRLTFAAIACVIAQLTLAGFSVYWERGMASMSTILFALPIVNVALLGSRTYTLAVSALACAVYTTACTKYFYDYFNEGYRVQLYGQLFFFSAVFMIIGYYIARLAHTAYKK